jgi:hypothetical protein
VVDDGEHIVNEWSTFLATGEPLDVEVDLRRANGEYRRLPRRNGPIGGQRKFREQQKDLRQLLDLAPRQAGVLGPDGSPLNSNCLSARVLRRRHRPIASGTVSSSPAYPRLVAATFLLSPATEER